MHVGMQLADSQRAASSKGLVESAGGVWAMGNPDSRRFFPWAVTCPCAPLCELAPMQGSMIRMIARAPTLPAVRVTAETSAATPPKMRR